MKKISMSLFLIAFVMLVSCKDNTAQIEKENTTPENKYENQGKVVVLNKISFIDLVMDFEKNPNNWVFKGEKPCVVDFYADWCRPCKMVAPIMEELAKEYEGKINIYKVNVDNEKELAGLFNIQSIPAILFCPKEGNPLLQPGAMSKEQYKQIFDDMLLKKSSDTTKSIN
jgi:thioredoxin 1